MTLPRTTYRSIQTLIWLAASTAACGSALAGPAAWPLYNNASEKMGQAPACPAGTAGSCSRSLIRCVPLNGGTDAVAQSGPQTCQGYVRTEDGSYTASGDPWTKDSGTAESHGPVGNAIGQALGVVDSNGQDIPGVANRAFNAVGAAITPTPSQPYHWVSETAEDGFHDSLSDAFTDHLDGGGGLSPPRGSDASARISASVPFQPSSDQAYSEIAASATATAGFAPQASGGSFAPVSSVGTVRSSPSVSQAPASRITTTLTQHCGGKQCAVPGG